MGITSLVEQPGVWYDRVETTPCHPWQGGRSTFAMRDGVEIWASTLPFRKESTMAEQIENDVAYYYDFHPTEEDLMGETSVHATLVHYLMEVLTWLFQGQACAIYENLNFYQTANPNEYPLAPDIAVIKGIPFRHLRSWKVGKSGPAPQVVFEIASEETWKRDLDEKPLEYARMGVQEYFAYDPNEPVLRRTSSQRLFGWQLEQDRVQPQMRVMPIGPGGRLWSAHLESFLV